MASLTITIPDQDAEAVQRQAAAEGLTPEQWLVRLVKRNSQEAAPPTAGDRRPLSARIRDIWRDLPADARAEYPEGGAFQIDQHVYGLPKR